MNERGAANGIIIRGQTGTAESAMTPSVQME